MKIIGEVTVESVKRILEDQYQYDGKNGYNPLAVSPEKFEQYLRDGIK